MKLRLLFSIERPESLKMESILTSGKVSTELCSASITVLAKFEFHFIIDFIYISMLSYVKKAQFPSP